MSIIHSRRPEGTLLCTLCGREIVLGEEYWACNGSRVCAACLGDFARGELAPFRETRGEGGRFMKLLEMSVVYAQSAEAIHLRIAQLREAERAQADPDAAWHLRRRIAELEPLLREARELSRLTAHYYDRSYFKHERYRI